MIEFVVECSWFIGMLFDCVVVLVVLFDFFYFSEFGLCCIVVLSLWLFGIFDCENFEFMVGGYFLLMVMGVYENVLFFDFKSLYFLLMCIFYIDFLGYVCVDDDVIEVLNGVCFCYEFGIFGGLFDEFMLVWE